MFETFFYKGDRHECHCLVAKDQKNKVFIFKELQENNETSVINAIEDLSFELSKREGISIKEMNIYEISDPTFGFSCSKIDFHYNDDGVPFNAEFHHRSKEQLLNEISGSTLHSLF